jgi:hypothetical protein
LIRPAAIRLIRTGPGCERLSIHLAAAFDAWHCRVHKSVGSGTIFGGADYFPATGRTFMARKYSKKASAKVERAMKERKRGTLKSGRSGRKVRSRKQAIAIGLSEARREGAKVPKKAAKKSKTASKRRATGYR